MAGRVVRERLAQDLGLWLADGLIPEETHALLRERYGAAGFGLAQMVKYLGLTGALLATFGVAGFVVALSSSVALAAALLLLAGGGLAFGGVRLSRDRLGRYGLTSKAVLALGAIGASAGVALLLQLAGLSAPLLPIALGTLMLPPLLWLSYRLGSGFLLGFALLGVFHWIGSWSGMLGHSTYALEVDDPRLMALAALGAIGVGLWHARELDRPTTRFSLIYQALGLSYLDLSLLILSLFPPGDSQLAWIAIFAAAGAAQVIAGARLHAPLFTGFGVTALGVNLYTRFFERFWDTLDQGLSLLLAGLALLGAGIALELWLKRRARRAA